MAIILFGAGTTGTATASFTVKPAAMSCEAEIFLTVGTTKSATSGKVSFTSIGGVQTVTLPVTMPSTGGYQYNVFLDITCQGILLAGFSSTPVVVPSVSNPMITWA